MLVTSDVVAATVEPAGSTVLHPLWWIGQMLKGTRNGILKRIQPVSIHGQVSWDVFFADLDDPDGQVHNARIGPEAVSGNIEPGDQIQIEYMVGVPVKITLVSAA